MIIVCPFFIGEGLGSFSGVWYIKDVFFNPIIMEMTGFLFHVYSKGLGGETL